MTPKPQSSRRRPSSKVNLLISLVFHTVIVGALAYFAAREGLLGKQLKKIAVEMIKEKPPEKPKEPEKPKVDPPKIDPPKVETAKAAPPPRTVTPPPTTPQAPPPSRIAAPPPVAPPAVDVPAFLFDGGKPVETTSDPVQLYKGFVEYSIRSKWNRPADIEDNHFIAEVEVSIDEAGRVSSPDWKRLSGNERWDSSVRHAVAATTIVGRKPPNQFPSRIVVRFDVQESADSFTP